MTRKSSSSKLPFHRRKRGWNPHRKRMGVIRKLRPFVTRSNRKRAGMVIRLKNRLQLERHIYGGRFVGSADIMDPARPDLYKQDAHVFFLGTDRRVFWNAYIVTARNAFWDAVGSLTSRRTNEKLPHEEKPWNIDDLFEPLAFNAWGQPTAFRMREQNGTYEALGGLTRKEYKSETRKRDYRQRTAGNFRIIYY